MQRVQTRNRVGHISAQTPADEHQILTLIEFFFIHPRSSVPNFSSLRVLRDHRVLLRLQARCSVSWMISAGALMRSGNQLPTPLLTTNWLIPWRYTPDQ
jgi:hypothetical protein